PVNGKLAKDFVLKKLKAIFENQHIGFYGHNVKYDYHIMKNEGIEVANISFDTILASYLLHAHERRHSLDELTLEYFGKKKIAISELIGKGSSEITMDQVPIDRVGTYCCEDVEYTYKLKKILEKKLYERGLEHLLQEVELPLVKVLA